MDNIAQELNETFVITLEVPGGTFGPGANIRSRLEGVIIDSDGRLTCFYTMLHVYIYRDQSLGKHNPFLSTIYHKY